MAASKDLYAWCHTLRRWADEVEELRFRERMLELASDLEREARNKEIAERQLV